MNWIQIKADISPNVAEAFEEALMAAGASAVTLEDAHDQPVLEPERGTTPLWDDTIITGLFNGDEDMNLAEKILKNVFSTMSDEALPPYRVEILENEDWTRKWIENLKPIKFVQRQWIFPSWH